MSVIRGCVPAMFWRARGACTMPERPCALALHNQKKQKKKKKKLNAAIVITGHVALKAQTGDEQQAGRWIHDREAEVRVDGA
jgi:hypothetical protein